MASPQSIRVRKYVEAQLAASYASRSMLSNFFSNATQSAAAQVVSVDNLRKSVMVASANGPTTEVFLQNRYVTKDDYVGALGQRVL